MQISIPFCYKFDEKGVTAMLPGNYWAEPRLLVGLTLTIIPRKSFGVLFTVWSRASTS